jgi:hypothetical protein
MWALVNRTSYGAERNWTRDKYGAHWWVVAVKATFDVSAGGHLTLADEQTPPLLAPEYFGEPGKSSLRCDSDLLAIKPATDVLVVANAHAPGGRPTATVPVSLRVGKLEKQLVVYGDRTYDRGRATSPRPFTGRPIRYEFAFGGSDYSDPDSQKHRIDERNPIGRGFAVRPSTLRDKPAHAIEYPSGNPAEKCPAGFGAIDPAWLPRRTLAGTYDAAWDKSKRPLLPDDYNPAFALSAPADQRTEKPLSGGERIELQNMTPEGLLRFELPHITLKFTTHISKRKVPHQPLLTTLLLEPEEKRVTLVWQSVLRVAAPDADYLDETEIDEGGSVP